jgi:hypothetical protein
MDRERRLAETFVELADTLIDDFDVIDFLQVLAARCVELLGVGAACGCILTQTHPATALRERVSHHRAHGLPRTRIMLLLLEG